MHPADWARLGLADGQPVRIASDHGSTVGPVDVTAAIRPGVVSLPHGWDAPGVNRLTSATADVEPLTGMPRFSGVPVEVTAARNNGTVLTVSRSRHAPAEVAAPARPGFTVVPRPLAAPPARLSCRIPSLGWGHVRRWGRSAG